MTDPPSDYERGVAAGGIEARLADHDRHFALINGSLVKVAENGIEHVRAINSLVLQVQRLADQADASARTAVATAKALKDADESRRAVSERAWTPWQRLIAVVGGLVSASVLVAAVAAVVRWLG